LLLWEPQIVHYHFHKIPSLVHIMSQINPLHIIPAYFFKIHLISLYSYTHIFIHHSSVALQPFVGSWLLLQFHNFFTQTVGLLGWVISPSQGHYLHTGEHKHRINAYTDIHALSGIRTHDPSVRASEDSLCLRSCGHRDRHTHIPAFKFTNQDSGIVTDIIRYFCQFK
jgi:hypothetical protein